MVSEAQNYVNFICPVCKKSFRKPIELKKTSRGLLTVLIKSHPKADGCPPFIAFVDQNGMHRGSQMIDNLDEFKEKEIRNELIKDAYNSVSEIEDKLRFFHLKFPRQGGRSFEHKVGNVSDRIFMSSRHYSAFINFLTTCENENSFGVMECDELGDSSNGLLLYGKYFGMIYTMFWKDQNELKGKTMDDLKGYANLTIEKLLDIYNLLDLFF